MLADWLLPRLAQRAWLPSLGTEAITAGAATKAGADLVIMGMTVERLADKGVELMQRYRISGVPVTEDGRLVGILTNRDLRFEGDFDQPIANVMTKENLVTVSVGTTLRVDHQRRRAAHEAAQGGTLLP